MTINTAPTDRSVTIVMPTHNRCHLVGRAIRSVLAQTYSAWELLVVDDGSRDDTRAAVAAFPDPRIRYIRNETPRGPAGARNTGIEAAGPWRYLAFLDDDDEWLPRKLEAQLALFANSDLPLVAVGCGRIDVSGDAPQVHIPQHRGDVFEDLLARRARGYGAQLIVVRRVSGDETELFDTALQPLEDLDFSIRLARKGPFDFVPEALVKIYRNDGGPHVWNSATAVRGYEELSRRYETELARRPWIRSYYDVCIARDLAVLGRMDECRGRLRQARKGAPSQSRVGAWQAAALLGRRGVHLAERLLPIGPPPPGQPLH